MAHTRCLASESVLPLHCESSNECIYILISFASFHTSDTKRLLMSWKDGFARALAWDSAQNVGLIAASGDVGLLCVMLERESVQDDFLSFVLSSTQSLSPVTTRTLPALTATASHPDSAVTETTTAWITQMRPVFEICVALWYKSKRKVNPHECC